MSSKNNPFLQKIKNYLSRFVAKIRFSVRFGQFLSFFDFLRLFLIFCRQLQGVRMNLRFAAHNSVMNSRSSDVSL